MRTLLFTQETITQAAHLLREGKLIAFPTETVYGLGADATNDDVISALFVAKGRPSDNPLIVHIPSTSWIVSVTTDWSPAKETLAQNFWPGPLTIVSKRHPSLSPLVSAGLDTVGIRIPDHPLALELLALVNRPLAAPSANLSGRPSPTTAEMVAHDLTERIAGILATKEPLTYGLESTVVSLDEARGTLYLLRSGFITAEDLAEALPGFRIEGDNQAQEKASPGTRYAHYQPACPVNLWNWRELLLEVLPHGEKIGVLVWSEGEQLLAQLAQESWQSSFQQDTITRYEKGEQTLLVQTFPDLGAYARGYYKALFTLEQAQVNLIVAQDCPTDWIGRALLNRLTKSSGGVRLSLRSKLGT